MEGLFRPTLNLGNSIIGVGILTMPYCIRKCGIILGLLLLAVSATFTIWSLKMLVRSAQMARKASYEQLAFHTFGRHGKLVIELSIIGLTIGCLIGFFIVIGDLTPPIVAKSLGVNWDPAYLRMFLMVFLACTVSLPLSLLKNVDSLSAVAMGSVFFYSCLLIRVIFMSLPHLTSYDVWSSVSLWRWDGLLHCLPICALALACQPQMFVIYIQMADPSVRKMSTVINGAIYFVATGYSLMAFFGYMNFVQDGVKGDVLSNFPHDSVSQMFRFGFSLSVVVSFPLVVFPIRASIYSLLFSKSSSMELHVAEPIPPKKFNLITVCIIAGTLIIAIMVPNVESVLALTGATTGSMVCYIFPSLIFLSVVGSHAVFSNRAKFLFVVGVLLTVVGTLTIVSEQLNPAEDLSSATKTRKFPRPFVAPPKIPDVMGPPVPQDFNNKKPPDGHPLPGGDDVINDVIKNDVIKNDVVDAVPIHNEEVRVPAANVGDNGGGEEVKLDNEVREGEGERREDGDGGGMKVEGGDGGGVKVGGGEEGGGLHKEQDSIKKDMAELKERIKAVEEENQELKDVLEMKQLVSERDSEVAAVVQQPPPEAGVNAPQNMEGDRDEQPEAHQAVRDSMEEAGVEGRREEHHNEEEKIKEERLPPVLPRQDGPEFDALGNNEGMRGEGERGDGEREDGRKREVETVLPKEGEEELGIDGVGGALDNQIAVAAATKKEEDEKEEEEMKWEEAKRVETEDTGPAGVVERGEKDGGRKVRELKAMTNGS